MICLYFSLSLRSRTAQYLALFLPTCFNSRTHPVSAIAMESKFSQPSLPGAPAFLPDLHLPAALSVSGCTSFDLSFNLSSFFLEHYFNFVLVFTDPSFPMLPGLFLLLVCHTVPVCFKFLVLCYKDFNKVFSTKPPSLF